MIIFNLTDKAKHGKEPSPQLVTVGGKSVHPGSKVEVPRVDLAKVSGMIYSGKIAIDKLPDWYIKARRDKRQSVMGESISSTRLGPPSAVNETEEEE